MGLPYFSATISGEMPPFELEKDASRRSTEPPISDIVSDMSTSVGSSSGATGTVTTGVTWFLLSASIKKFGAR